MLRLASACAAALSLAACGVSDDTAGSTPGDTTVAQESVPPDTSAPPTTDAEPEEVARIAPFLSSVVSADEFEPDAYELFWTVNRVIETDDARAAFIERLGGPSDALLDIDLDSQFVIVMTSGRCTVPANPPDLVIDAERFRLDEEIDQVECYAPESVLRFYAVDDAFRDRFSGAVNDLSYVITTGRQVTTMDGSDLVGRLDGPTWVESPADTAVLAARIDDPAVRRDVTSFSHQSKLLVPAAACHPGRTGDSIVIGDEVTFRQHDFAGDEVLCDAEEMYAAVFFLNDVDLARLEAVGARQWPSLADGVDVVTATGPNHEWSKPSPDLGFDRLESHVISTPESLAASTLGADFGAGLAPVDLDEQFLVVIARRDCERTEGHGLLILDDGWILAPPLPATLDCDEPNASIRGYAIDRAHIDVFADLPEGQR